MPRSCQVTSAGPLNVRRPAKWITATHTAGGDSASQAAGLDQRDTQAIGRACLSVPAGAIAGLSDK
ncbi:MAG TPA: hypothetical protein VF293_04075, partial [Candidatus Limnocylindrales bacterium]